MFDHLDVVRLILAVFDVNPQVDAFHTRVCVLDAGQQQADDSTGSGLIDGDATNVRTVFCESKNGSVPLLTECVCPVARKGAPTKQRAPE